MSALAQTDKIFFASQKLDLDHTLRTVRETLQGADDGELYLEYAQSEGFSWDDGRLKTASFETEQGFGLRACSGETVGFAHASALDEGALTRAAAAVQSVKDGHAHDLALPPAGTNRLLYDDLNPLASKSFEEKMALLQTIDAYVRARDPRVKQVNVSLAATWQAVQIIGASGARVADIRPLVRLTIAAYVEQGGRLEAAAFGGGGRTSYLSSFDPAVWQAYADEALRKALVNLEAVPAKAGEMTVVLGPGWPAVLLHEAVGHGLEGDFHRKKTSAFSGLMGQKVAADGVTVVDDGTLEGKRGSLSLDDEGTPTQSTVLIENGVLVGLMQDRLNARLMGMVPTGNGRRESFACQPYPRMTNTMMLAGAHDPQEIIASVDKGLYAADFGGGQVDIVSGKFVFSATEAYEIEGGRLGRPVKGASLVGTGFEALQRVRMIGNDFRLDNGSGSCGKHGQSIPVGIGQPTLRLDNMTVGGTEMAD